MRRSSVVQLTLLPLVASAAIAAADPAPPLAPPGMSEPTLAPPGLTPTEDECLADPALPFCDLDYFACDAGDPDCEPAVALTGNGIIRGGFGGYFWVSHS